jgi:hypothetical protein
VNVPGRQNFTIAHELGHYLLHRKTRDEFQCSQRDILMRGETIDRRQETEANVFASYLLMPIDDFRRQTDGQEITFDLLGCCAGRYGVSLTAATLKWLEFTTDIAVLVVARDGFVLWSRPSEKARKLGLHLRRGAPLPKESLAAAGDAFRTEDRDGKMAPAGSWHPTEPTFEMKIESDRFEYSISLVRFPRSLQSPAHEEEEPSDGYDHVMQPFERGDH